MRLNPFALGIANTIITVILYIGCSAFYVLAKESYFSLATIGLHYDFSSLAIQMTVKSFFLGLILWILIGYVTGWLFAWIYNQFVK